MQTKILWADDEIDLLKPHILFLESKGYTVAATNNGSDAVALYFFLNGYIEEIIEENPEMESIVNERGGLPVTMDDWFDWLRDEVVGIGMTAEEEEVIRSNFELISFLVYFFIFFWFFCLISSFFSSLF